MATSHITAVALSGVVLLLFVLRQILLPRPIPGVPHNAKSTRRLLGDIPNVLRHINKTGEIASFMQKASQEFNTPMFQLFMRPFARPWVVITDFREAQDIVARRTREFDRSDFFREIFSSLVPGAMVHMPTGDAWKAQRKLVGDTMSPAFLENVSAPQIYETGKSLVELWREKARLAAGHAFSIKEDLYRSGLDTIWAVAFGSQIGATRGQLHKLSGIDRLDSLDNGESEIVFPTAPDPASYEDILALVDSMEIPVSSAFPRLHHWLALKFKPSLVRAGRHKDMLIAQQIDGAVSKFSGMNASDEDIKCALDFVIRREVQQAAKENRPADPMSVHITDELYSFLIAGHDTSATTLSWGLKLLTNNPDVQNKLRQCLYEEFAGSKKGTTLPSVKNISGSRLPYLEATLAEIYRLSGTSTAIFRRTTTDVVVLGQVIPKGTDVCLLTFGPDFVSPPLPVDETLRSDSSRDAKDKSNSWDVNDISVFKPERWLKAGPDGRLEFDPQSGPSMLFGGGMRGCFGRRLAELQIKIMLTMIIWSFQLEETPANLSSYKAKDGITHAPRQCYLKLVTVK